MPNAFESYDQLRVRHLGLGAKLRVLSLADVLNRPPRAYLLPGLIAPQEMSVWWGAPKCGKSFLMLRFAFGLALGRGMWGKEPERPIRVLYGAAEGEGGLGARVAALRDELGDPGDALAFIAQRIQLGGEGEHLNDFIAAAKDHRADLVIVDTLARTFGEGDEDRAQDMGSFIGAMDRIREEAAAHVAIVHHGAKDPNARTPRGSGALIGAADLVVRVKKGEEGGPSLAVVEHAKDDEDGTELPFRLRIVEVEQPGREPRKTCIAEEADGSPAGTKRPKLRGQTARAMSLLNDLIAASGDILPSGPMSPSDSSIRCVGWEDWKEHCRKSSLSGDGGNEAEKKAFQRSAKQLLEGRFIATAEGDGRKVVWVARVSGT
jgi:hypothetical protein